MGEGLFSLYNLHLLEVQPLPRYIAMESGDNLFTFLIEERKILKSRSQVSPAHSKILFRGLFATFFMCWTGGGGEGGGWSWFWGIVGGEISG